MSVTSFLVTQIYVTSFLVTQTVLVHY